MNVSLSSIIGDPDVPLNKIAEAIKFGCDPDLASVTSVMAIVKRLGQPCASDVLVNISAFHALPEVVEPELGAYLNSKANHLELSRVSIAIAQSYQSFSLQLVEKAIEILLKEVTDPRTTGFWDSPTPTLESVLSPVANALQRLLDFRSVKTAMESINQNHNNPSMKVGAALVLNRVHQCLKCLTPEVTRDLFPDREE